LIGTSGVDTVALNAGAVIAPIFIDAEADNDIVTLTAATNTATVDMGTGADIVNTNDTVGTSTIRGNDGNDTINIADGLRASWFNGNAGNDDITVAGTITASSIHGGQGNDLIDATNGITFNGGRINGNIGDDIISVLLSADMTSSGSNAATINGGQGADIIDVIYELGDDFAAIVSGDDGNDVLNTGTGADSLYGGAGEDVIDGGFNDDTMVGGDGVDTFYSNFSLDDANPGNAQVFLATGTSSPVNLSSSSSFTTFTTARLSEDFTNIISTNAFGFDVITDFTAGVGGDRINFVAEGFEGAIGWQTRLSGAGNYAISGSYNATSGDFTMANTATQGADTLIVTIGIADTGFQGVVLRNVNATQFVATNLI